MFGIKVKKNLIYIEMYLFWSDLLFKGKLVQKRIKVLENDFFVIKLVKQITIFHFPLLGDGRSPSLRRVPVFSRPSDHRLAFRQSRIRERDSSQQLVAQTLGSGD